MDSHRIETRSSQWASLRCRDNPDAQRTEACRNSVDCSSGRLCQLRMVGLEEADRTQWCIDNWEAVAAEVGAELGVSRGRGPPGRLVEGCTCSGGCLSARRRFFRRGDIDFGSWLRWPSAPGDHDSGHLGRIDA